MINLNHKLPIICTYILIFQALGLWLPSCSLNIIVFTLSNMNRNAVLSQKVSEINDSFNQKYNHFQTKDSLESKVLSIRKKMTQAIEKHKSEMEKMIEDATVLLKKTEKANLEYEEEANAQMKKLKKIADNVAEKVEIEIMERKQREDSIVRAFEDKTNFLRKQIEKQKRIRESLFAQLSSTLEEDLPTIMNQLIDGREQLSQEQEKSSEIISALVEESEKTLLEFKQEQQQNRSKAFELIKDLTKKIKSEIEQQKQICSITQEEVISYVEDACNQLDGKSS